MIIAAAYDRGEIWQHFGETEYFKFYQVEDGRVTGISVVSAAPHSHAALADFLTENKVDEVICGGIGAPMVKKLEGYGMKVYPGVSGSVDDAVKARLSGTLRINAGAIHEGCHHFEG